MNKRHLFPILFLAFSLPCLAQPYGGTIFVDADIITPADSSALESVSYTGMGTRLIFDRRVNSWITVNAFLFEVSWSDGLTSEAIINPEFETMELAQVEAEKYAWHIGQLPYCLRTDVNGIWINKGVELFGGGNFSILIHTGQTVNYENDGILEETLVHEASHTSLDAAHAASAGWLNAQALDGGFISDYAEEFPDREDIAESFLMWMAVRYRADQISTQDYNLITEAIPNRLAYFDDIVCDLFPFETENTTNVQNLSSAEQLVQLYPNPTQGIIQLQYPETTTATVQLYNSQGALLWSQPMATNVDLTALPAGMYWILLDIDGQRVPKKVVKE